MKLCKFSLLKVYDLPDSEKGGITVGIGIKMILIVIKTIIVYLLERLYSIFERKEWSSIIPEVYTVVIACCNKNSKGEIIKQNTYKPLTTFIGIVHEEKGTKCIRELWHAT